VQKISDKERILKQKEFLVGSKTLTYSMMDHELDYLRKKIRVMEIEDERTLKAKSIERFSQRSQKQSYFNFNKNSHEPAQKPETKSATGIDLEAQELRPQKGIFTFEDEIPDIDLEVGAGFGSADKENAQPNTNPNTVIKPTIKISDLGKNKNLSSLLMKKRSTVFADKIFNCRNKRPSRVSQTGVGKNSPGAKSMNLPVCTKKSKVVTAGDRLLDTLGQGLGARKESIPFDTIDAIDLEAEGMDITSDSVSMISSITPKNKSAGGAKIRKKVKKVRRESAGVVPNRYKRITRKKEIKDYSSSIGLGSKRTRK